MDAEARARLDLAGEHHWPAIDPAGVRVMVGLADLRALLAAHDALLAGRSSAAGQIDKLASYILEHCPGEPSRSEGAVDVAIRLLAERDALKAALTSECEVAQNTARFVQEERERAEAAEARLDRLAAVEAAARAYADRWENGTDTEMLQARTALLDAVAALPAAPGGVG